MGKLWAVVEALYYGKSLGNPETWKNVQTGTNAVLIILAVIPEFVPELQFSDAQMHTIAQAIMIIGGGVVNAYFTTATSDKVGIKKK